MSEEEEEKEEEEEEEATFGLREVMVKDCSKDGPKMFEDACLTFFNITHKVWERGTLLPWPLGVLVSIADEGIKATVQPLLKTLESRSLEFARLIDDRVVVKDDSKNGPKIVASACLTFFNITHKVWERGTLLPWPLGFAVRIADKSIKATVQPLLLTLENRSLEFAEFVDDQIVAVENLVAALYDVALKAFQHVREFSMSPNKALETSNSAASHLQRRGLAGSIADLWICNEDMLRNESFVFLQIIEKLPGGKLFKHFLFIFGNPIAESFSMWLMSNSESKDKHTVLSTVSSSSSDLDLDTHEKCDAPEHHLSDIDSKQPSSFVSPSVSPVDHATQEFSEKSEVMDQNSAAENLACITETLNLASSNPAEYTSGQSPAVAIAHDEPDPLLLLFEHSWSLGSPPAKKQ